jgi:hypothetical protein
MLTVKTTGSLCAAVVVAALLASQFGAGSTRATVRCTTWNLQWFPNGAAKDASPEEQDHRIADAANVLKPLHPDILLLQEVRDYAACSRLGNAIEPGAYHMAICSAFKEPFQSGLGRQQVAIRDFRHKQPGRNSGNLSKELTHLEVLRLRGLRFKAQTSAFTLCI